MNDIGLRDQDVLVLSEILRDSSIQEMILQKNYITVEGIKHLAQTLKSHHTIRSLILDNNQLKDEGLLTLAGVLENNPQLIQLGLADNAIGDSGVVSLVNALKLTNNRIFPAFNLPGNVIGDKGCSAIADFCAKNNTVLSVVLDHNLIGDDGLIALAAAMLSSEFNVSSISLSNNQLSSKSISTLPEAIMALKVPLELDLSDNPLLTRKALSVLLKANISVSVTKFQIKRKFEDEDHLKKLEANEQAEVEIQEEIAQGLRVSHQGVGVAVASVASAAGLGRTDSENPSKVSVVNTELRGKLASVMRMNVAGNNKPK